MAIEDLTPERLLAYGFNYEQIERLETWPGYETFHQLNNKDQIYFASVKDRKIYTGIDAARKQYFRPGQIIFPHHHRELMAEYFQIRCDEFLKMERQEMGSLYEENEALELFAEDERNHAQKLANPSYIKLVERLITGSRSLKNYAPGKLPGLNHRHIALIDLYLFNAKILKKWPGKSDLKKEYGSDTQYNRGHNTVWNKKSDSYIEPKAGELKTIIPFLKQHKPAQNAAVNDLAKLEKGLS